MLVEGYVSERAAPVMAVELELVRVMVMFVAPPIRIVLELKVLAAVGGANAVRVAAAAVPEPALVVVMLPVLLV